jgi:hypothetical protein
MRAPSATKAGSAGAAGARASGLRRDSCAERDTLGNAGLDFAMKDRRERSTLRDQFGLGLLDQLSLIDLEKIQAEQRQ